MSIPQVFAAVDFWAMEPDRLERTFDALGAGATHAMGDDDEEDGDGDAMSVAGSVATIPVRGMLLKSGASDARDFGISATGYDEIGASLARAMADGSVKNIVLSIDSPGGEVAGCQMLADQISACPKPVQAHVQDLCASAAYWLAAQCEDITANRGALIGGIGVYRAVRDTSRAQENAGVKTYIVGSGGVKGHGHPGTAITPEVLADMKRVIDARCEQFSAAVATGRGISSPAAMALADGRVHMASDAHGLGLIDHVSNSPGIIPTMKIEPARMAALIKEHSARACVIADMCAADKTEAEILSHIKDAQTAELATKSEQVMAAHAALKTELENAKAAAVTDAQALKTAHAAELAAKDAALAELKGKHDALAALAKNGVTDPGEQHGGQAAELPKFTGEQARSGTIPAELLKSGKYQITE